jgi:chitin disaccharide deacetylase
MLIITADDYGETPLATDRILECYHHGSLTSASAMVFMADSERAATLARGSGVEFGLHLNLTEAFTAPAVAEEVRRRHAQVACCLNRHRYAQVLFHPLLAGAFGSLVNLQWTEFERLYGHPPVFVNGHHHMHLCTNVLGQRLLPRQARLRGPFTFQAGEKGRVNRWYRRRVARHLRKNFITPDCLYSIEPLADTERLRRIAREAATRNVELEVHPEYADQHQFLLSPAFQRLLAGVELHGFSHLKPPSALCPLTSGL